MGRSSEVLRSMFKGMALLILLVTPLRGIEAAVENASLILDVIPDSPMSLRGTWHYFPGKLLSPQEVPTLWDQGLPRPVPAVAGTPAVLSYEKLGTLALRLEKKWPARGLWGLNEMVGYTACEVFWVQKDETGQWHQNSILKVGQVAAIPEQTQSRMTSGLAAIDWSGTEAWLIIHISNPNGPSALFTPPAFGPLEVMQKAEINRRVASFLALGMFCMIFIFNVGLFLQRREDKESIWLAACVICLAMRYMGTEFLLMYWIENPPSWLLSMQTLSQVNMTAFALGFYASFLRAAYPGYVRNIYLWPYWIACLAYAYFQLFLNSIGSPATWLYFVIPQLLFAFYMIKETLRAAYHRLIGSGYIAAGLGLLILGFLNDFLVFTNAMDGIYLGQYGMILWTVALTMSIGKQFAKAFRTARRLTRSLKEEVEQQTRNIRSVLTNLRQGLFTFDASFQVLPEYSNHTEVILKESRLAGRPALPLLFNDSNINEETRSMVESALVSALGEDHLAFELNQGNLPRELIRGQGEQKTFIELDWAPMLNEKNETQRILLTMRDVTEVRRLKSINDQNQENLDLIYRILSIDEHAFGEFIINARNLISECQQLAAPIVNLDREVIKVIFINLHTVKGNARSYHLDQLTLILHKLEQACSDWLHNKLNALSIATLNSELEAIYNLIQHYETINSRQLKRQIQGDKVQWDRLDILGNLADLDHILTQGLDRKNLTRLHQLRSKLIDLAYCDPALLMQDIRMLAERVARDLGHEIPKFELTLIDIRLTHKTQTVLKHVFIHLIRNALDHGIEKVPDRMKAHKPVAGLLQIAFTRKNDQLVLSVKDDGRGLALQKLRKKGMETQRLSLQQDDPQKIAQLIFMEGISTSEEVTDISGRGIGMASIKRFLEEHGATITIVLDQAWQGEPYVPFHFEMTFPPAAFIDLALKPLPTKPVNSFL